MEAVVGLEFLGDVFYLLVGALGEVRPVVELGDGDEEGVVGSGEFWGGDSWGGSWYGSGVGA